MSRVIPSLLVVLGAAWLAVFAETRWHLDTVPTRDVGLVGRPEGPQVAAGQRVEVPPPPFTEGMFPCSGCHADLTPNPQRRPLTAMHDDIQLRHDEEHRWCLDCHDAADRDVLHLASGDKVPFEESYRVCGQCHGEKYRDWRAGVHGRRSGEWNGHKTYLLCAHCHNPHQPRFQPIAPKPAPRRPGAARPAAHGDGQ
jgi:hypothetical protein